MKQVVQSGKGIEVVEVPPPMLEAGCVLVSVSYSLISAGTEVSSIQGSGGGLIQKALRQPQKVLKVLNMVRTQGVNATRSAVEAKLSMASALGYSCAGTVTQVGAGVDDLQPGDRVACAGAGKASHAEWVVAPRNLVARIPAGVHIRDAASTTLGAIAMQGVRRADLRLGEWAAVIGLGLLGQITAQLLRAAGVNVIGFDLDPARVEKAKACGLAHAFCAGETDPVREVLRLTQRYGVDAALITAASRGDAIAQQAIQMTRKKGKVVVVGAVGLGLQRSPLYEKEIDFLISCSYGPGRYDPQYEEKGLDYPYAYVRWTENRNMGEYLRLLENGQVDFAALIDAEYPIDQAAAAYAALQAPRPPVAVMFRYPAADQAPVLSAARRLNLPVTARPSSGEIRVALVGAGGFAQGMHLPNLKQLSSLYKLRAVVSRGGVNARNVGLQFGADYVATDYQEVLADPDVDMLLICTRHDLHAAQVIQAIEAGKAVLVEKPLALTLEELERVEQALTRHPVPFMVGFNRRFSPAAVRAKEILAAGPGPFTLLYRVNAGFIPLSHWTQGPEGGGRLIGEACHMVDLLQYLAGPARMTDFHCTPLRAAQEHLGAGDNFSLNIRYSDGSLATLLYTALGTSDFPKEYLEIYAGDRVLVLDDFKSLRVHGAALKGWQSDLQDKGHLNELKAFAAWMSGKGPAPIPPADLFETTRLTIQAAQAK